MVNLKISKYGVKDIKNYNWIDIKNKYILYKNE